MFEQKVYDRLGAEPVGVDEICEGVGIAPGELLATLLSLEFKGCIRQLAGKRFLRT